MVGVLRLIMHAPTEKLYIGTCTISVVRHLLENSRPTLESGGKGKQGMRQSRGIEERLRLLYYKIVDSSRNGAGTIRYSRAKIPYTGISLSH